MKNIFYFDSNYELTLLLNEQCDENCIFFNIETDATANQYLDIVCNTQTTSQLLESGKINVFQLTGERWATGGCTTFRLRNDVKTTEWYNINFPETMSSDMCLCETSDYYFTAQCQKSEFDVNEIKSSTLVYTNGRAYEINKTPKKIITIQYTALQECNGVFTATILIKAHDITDKANLKFRVQINKVYNESFTPIQTIENGEHIITIHYPILNIVKYNANTISIYAEVDDGACLIEQEKIRASITCNGLMSDFSWDGTIEAEDVVSAIDLKRLTVESISDSVSVTNPILSNSGITETVSIITLKRLTIDNITDSVEITAEVESEG